ncbi:hypothetical protein ACWU37_16455 [Photobacterium damselae subsp. damselae]
MATDYRKNKIQILGQFLSSDDAKIVQDALDLAAKNVGVTNNRKNRYALLEMARCYIEANTND